MAVTGPKRTEFEREANLVEIKDAYLRGDTQMSIAERLGLSQAQISRDLATIQRRWRESALVDINEAKRRKLESGIVAWVRREDVERVRDGESNG